MVTRSRDHAARTCDQTPPDFSRRLALKAVGRFAAHVTPAMAALLKGASAEACHKPGHQNFSGQICSPTP